MTVEKPHSLSYVAMVFAVFATSCQFEHLSARRCVHSANYLSQNTGLGEYPRKLCYVISEHKQLRKIYHYIGSMHCVLK